MTRTTTKVVFERPLRAAAIVRPDDPAVIERAERQAAITTLSALRTQIQTAETTVQRWMQELHEQSVSLAIEIAKTVLQSDDQLIEQRIEQFAKLSTESLPRTEISSITVHPSCEKHIRAWIAQSDLRDVDVRSRASVPAGDCLVESGDTGVMAALDSCFDTVLDQLVREPGLDASPQTAGANR